MEEKDEKPSALALEEAVFDDRELEEDDIAAWVNAVASTTDDPSTPAFTIRTVLIGIAWGAFLAVANTIFSFRQNIFVIPPALVLLMAYPMGVFMASVLPKSTIYGIDLNPGPFTVKEHALIYIIAGSAGTAPYGIDNVVGQRFTMFMGNQSIGFWNSLPWILGTQLIGYGLAGISRRYLVKPAAMMWPSILPTVALLNSFHNKDEESSKYPLSRYSFFWLVFLFGFLWAWIPLYFAPVLSMVSILCFMSSNRTLKFLGSANTQEGPGILALTFDWSIIQAQNPLYTPFWAACNYFGGYIFWTWLIIPWVYYTNPFGVGGDKGYIVQSQREWGGGHNVSNDPFPQLNDAHIYDKFGKLTKVSNSSGLLKDDYSLNETFYETHGPFYLSASFTVAYFTSFINIAAVFSHVFLWYGADVYRQFREALQQLENQDEDDHNRLMRSYKDVPDWFYVVFLLVFSGVMIVSGELTAFKIPWWSTIFGIVLGSVYVIPIGVIQAISGFQMGLNVLTEFVIGLLTPGDTIGVMCFKSLGFNMVIQALQLLSGLKQGHYQHISPFFMFVSQLIGTVLGSLLNLMTALWAENGLKSQMENDPSWYPVGYTTFTNAGGIWGAIGPARFFGIGSPYQSLLWGFGIGLIAPFIPWLLNRYFPNPTWKLINIPLMCQQNQVAANQAFIVVPFALNVIFNKFIFKYRREWWEKYTFILGIGMDSSTAIAILCVTLLQFVGPDFASVGPYPFAPVGSPDYYCLEETFMGLPTDAVKAALAAAAAASAE